MPKRIPHVYLAGPCFGTADLDLNRKNASALSGVGVEVHVPQVFAEKAAQEGRWNLVRQLCLDHLKSCDIVLANLDGPDIDSGTAYEIAMAVAWKKEILAVRSDTRLAGEKGNGNCMTLRSPGLTLYGQFHHAIEEICSRLPLAKRVPLFSSKGVRYITVQKAKPRFSAKGNAGRKHV